jgi:hypothetical protein
MVNCHNSTNTITQHFFQSIVVLPNVVARLDEFVNLDRHGGFFLGKAVGYAFHISVHVGVGRQLLYTKIIKLFVSQDTVEIS